MKRNILFAAVMLAAGSLLAADAKDEITAAAKKLGDQSNYSWKTSVETANPPAGGGGGGGRRGRGGFGGPVAGKTEKGGFTVVTMGEGDNAMEGVVKGDKGAIKGQDGWQSFAEATADDGGGNGPNFARFRAMRVKNLKTPAVEAEALAGKVKELKKTDDMYSGDLTEEGAKSLMAFGGRGGNGPEISGAKGTAKFWVKDGQLTKYEYNVQGTISFNGNDREINNTTKVEIKDIGTTKVEVPEEAKKKSA